MKRRSPSLVPVPLRPLATTGCMRSGRHKSLPRQHQHHGTRHIGAPPPSREVYESRNPKVEPSKMSTMDPSAPEPVPEPTGPEPMPPVVMPDMDIDLDM